VFGTDGYYIKTISLDQMRFQRFMAIACGLAAMGATLSGDIFNFTLFTSMIGICCIGIVAGAKNRHVLQAAYEYGIVVMTAMVPLFGGAAIIAATTGTLSIFELSAMREIGSIVPLIAKALLVIGVMGEGMAPFYVSKAEITRAQGAPYILMIHVCSLLIFLRVIEIVIAI
jgi:energy-converting hydrogenase A subunit H